jgi:hypothetical protein
MSDIDFAMCDMSRDHALRPVTHYLRHQCTNCRYHQIFSLCAQCADQCKAYIGDIGDKFSYNLTFCPKCWKYDRVNEVWLVYAPVPGYE